MLFFRDESNAKSKNNTRYRYNRQHSRSEIRQMRKLGKYGFIPPGAVYKCIFCNRYNIAWIFLINFKKKSKRRTARSDF